MIGGRSRRAEPKHTQPLREVLFSECGWADLGGHREQALYANFAGLEKLRTRCTHAEQDHNGEERVSWTGKVASHLPRAILAEWRARTGWSGTDRCGNMVWKAHEEGSESDDSLSGLGPKRGAKPTRGGTKGPLITQKEREGRRIGSRWEA